MSVSIIIPCKNEEDNILNTINKLENKLSNINFEIIIIDDYSTDSTAKKIQKAAIEKQFLKYFHNDKKGLGGAINLGIQKSKEEFVCIFMADMSDDPDDLVKYFNLIKKNKYDAVFGSRFMKGSKISDYPYFKLILNRFFNIFVQLLFFTKFNDTTNAFKLYSRKSLLELMPLVSENFNIFLEIPLKIISRKYKFCVTPISWSNRKKGISSFKIKELGSKYLFTLIYIFAEKILLNKNK